MTTLRAGKASVRIGGLRVVVGDHRVLMTPLAAWLRRQERVALVFEVHAWAALRGDPHLRRKSCSLDADVDHDVQLTHTAAALSAAGKRVIVLIGNLNNSSIPELLHAGAEGVISKTELIILLVLTAAEGTYCQRMPPQVERTASGTTLAQPAASAGDRPLRHRTSSLRLSRERSGSRTRLRSPT